MSEMLMEAPRARTLAELAKLAGVSTGTASRALAGSPLVRVETRVRIQEIAAAHGFKPNALASRLRSGRSGIVRIVVPLGHEQRQHISDPFFMAMLGALADNLTESGHDILLSRVVPEHDGWLRAIVESRLADGVIVIGQSDQMEVLEAVAREYLPLVVWGAVDAARAQCTVGCDNFAGGRLAAEHLVARGAEHIVFLGDVRTPEVDLRWRGCVEALASAGLPEPRVVATSLAADAVESELSERLAQLRGEVDGVVAASDVVAMTALRVLADWSVRVPEDIKVIGFDDLSIASQTVPRLSTVRQDIGRGAALLIERLLQRIDGRSSTSVQIMPELVARGST